MTAERLAEAPHYPTRPDAAANRARGRSSEIRLPGCRGTFIIAAFAHGSMLDKPS